MRIVKIKMLFNVWAEGKWLAEGTEFVALRIFDNYNDVGIRIDEGPIYGYLIICRESAITYFVSVDFAEEI